LSLIAINKPLLQRGHSFLPSASGWLEIPFMERAPGGMLDELISAKCAGTLTGLLHERVRRTPMSVAYG